MHVSTRGELPIPRDQWVWDAIAAGEVRFAKTGTAIFDFGGSHPDLGTPLTAFLNSYLCGKGAFRQSEQWTVAAKEVATELTKWLMEHGAEPSAVVPDTAKDITLSYTRPDEEGTEVKGKGKGARVKESTVRLRIGGKAASTVVLELRERVYEAIEQDNRWKVIGDLLDHLFKQIATNAAPHPASARRVHVPEAVVDLWERALHRGDLEGDLRIVASDCEGVGVHSHMLEEASPVLKAMLRSSMREGHTGVGHSPAREVRVEESAAAVRAFVGLLYTGGLPTGEGGEPAPSAETLLGVFGLCHRWQLAPLAELLEERLATMIMPENLEIMLEAAALHGAAALRRACLDAARGSVDLESKFHRGDLRPRALSELQGVFCTAATQKRRRTSL